MFPRSQILVSRLGLVISGVVLANGLSACGQTGILYLPTEAAAAKRATLPETLKPGLPPTPQVSTPPITLPPQ